MLQLQNIYITLAWVLCLQLAAWGIGRPLYRLLTGKSEQSLTAGLDAVFSAGLGYIVLAYAAFSLAALHILYPWVLIAGTLACAIRGAVQLFHMRPVRWPALSWQDIPLLLGIVFLASHIPNELYPVLGHDDNVYHLLIPRLYLENHGLIYLPSNLYANMPHIVEVLYTIPMAIGDFTAPKVLSVAFSFWTIAALYVFALPLLGRFGAGLVPLLYLSGKNIQFHFELAHIEPVMGFFLLCACLSLLTWRETRNPGFLRILALACGFVMASKYTGWFFASALFFLATLLILQSRDLSGIRSRLRLLAELSAILLLLIAPWLIKNALLTGNPIYPNLYSIFDGSFWSQIQEMHYLRSQDYAGAPNKTFLTCLLLPWHLLKYDEIYFYCPVFSASLMALWLIALIRPSSYRLPQWPLPVISIAGFALWAFSAQQGRFLVALVPVMTAAAALALVPLRNRLRLLIAVFCSIMAIGAYQITAQLYPYAPHFEVFTHPRGEPVQENINYHLCTLLNQVVPENGKVLALWDNKFFFLKRTFYADSSYHAPAGLARLRKAGTPSAFAAELINEGFTHVVINMAICYNYFNNAMEFSLINEWVYPESRLEKDRLLCEDFINTYCEPIQDLQRWQELMPNVMIYRIKKELFLN